MENEKNRFGEKMRLIEKAREDIYFADKDRELIEKLRARLKRVERPGEDRPLACLKCRGILDSYLLMEFLLDRCQGCGGLWLDRGELEGVLKKVSRGPLASLVDGFLSRREPVLPDQPSV